MVKKKNAKSNIENKRVLFFEIGATVALAALLVAFEWGVKDVVVADNYMSDKFDIVEEIDMIITKPEVQKPAPPPMPIDFDIIDDPMIEIDDDPIEWTSDINVNDGLFPIFDLEDEEPVSDEPFIRVEKMPTYQGNPTVYFQRHLQELVRYPQTAAENGIQGMVFVQFVVDEKGNIIREQVIKSPHPALSEAVLSAIKKTNQWKAGEQRGRKVKVSFTVPVSFKLAMN